MCCIYLASCTATVHTRQSPLNQVHSKETQKRNYFWWYQNFKLTLLYILDQNADGYFKVLDFCGSNNGKITVQLYNGEIVVNSIVYLVVSKKAWGPFLERPGIFSGPKANFKINTCCIVVQFLAHNHFQNYLILDLECNRSKHKTAFQARKVTRTFEKQGPCPSPVEVQVY